MSDDADPSAPEACAIANGLDDDRPAQQAQELARPDQRLTSARPAPAEEKTSGLDGPDCDTLDGDDRHLSRS